MPKTHLNLDGHLKFSAKVLFQNHLNADACNVLYIFVSLSQITLQRPCTMPRSGGSQLILDLLAQYVVKDNRKGKKGEN